MEQTSTSVRLRRNEPFPAERVEQIKSDFLRDGFALIPGVFDRAEVDALRAAANRVFDEPRWFDTDNVYGPRGNAYIAVRLFEVDPIFEETLTHEPIISIAEAILGPNCHLVAENLVRNAPGQAIDKFHVDDVLMFPVSDRMERHDPRLTMPVYMLTVQILLTDVPSIEYGPTQFVPGSHYSGRHPDDPQNPTFAGRGPVSIFGRAGDIYLHNGQCWHRGAPNTSNRRRYLLQLAYGMRWVSQRFYPFVNYQLPAGVLERADARRRRVLGLHPKGPYG